MLRTRPSEGERRAFSVRLLLAQRDAARAAKRVARLEREQEERDA